MQRILFMFLIPSIFLFWQGNDFYVKQVLAQSSAREDEKALIAEEERLKFKADMQNLLDAASKSGFSEKEIREITVTRNGKLVKVWDFLEQAKLQQKKDKLANKRSKPLERYLTVMDIVEEMESGETKDLDSLKDKSIFVGAEEK